MNNGKPSSRGTEIAAERIRHACVEVAKKAYEEAGISGLCAEGRWECALQAMQSVDLRSLEDDPPAPAGGADV